MRRELIAAATFSGILPGVAASVAVPVVDAIPGWLFLTVLCSAMVGGATWVWRCL